MPKHTSPIPDGLDLRDAIDAIEREFLVKVRVKVELGGAPNLSVRAYAWREIEGVRIGIAWVESFWSPAGRPLTGTMLGVLHKLYWKVSDLAHSGARPPHNPGPPA